MKLPLVFHSAQCVYFLFHDWWWLYSHLLTFVFPFLRIQVIEGRCGEWRVVVGGREVGRPDLDGW